MLPEIPQRVQSTNFVNFVESCSLQRVIMDPEPGEAVIEWLKLNALLTVYALSYAPILHFMFTQSSESDFFISIATTKYNK